MKPAPVHHLDRFESSHSGKAGGGDNVGFGEGPQAGFDEHNLRLGSVEGFHDYLATRENSPCGFRIDARPMGGNLRLGIDGNEVFLQCVHLESAYLGKKIILPIQVGAGDFVEIGDDEPMNPRSYEGSGAVGTESAGSGNAYHSLREEFSHFLPIHDHKPNPCEAPGASRT